VKEVDASPKMEHRIGRFYDLPIEMVTEIMQYLPEHELFWNISFVSKYLRSIAISLIKVIDICEHSVTDPESKLQILLSNKEVLPLIRHIMICSGYAMQMKSEWIQSKTRVCNPFKLLVLGNTHLTNKTSNLIANTFPKIESLILPHYGGSSKMTSRGFRNILESCKSIKDIDLRDSEYNFQSSYNPLKWIAENSKNLEYINVNRCNPNDHTLTSLFDNCHNLKTVCLKRCTQLSDNSLYILSHSCESLDCLNLDYCTRITDDGIIKIATRFPKLLELSLRYCNITDNSLKVIGQNCSELTILNLRGCQVSDESIEIIGRNCLRLANLDLSMSNGTLSNESIKLVAQNCKRLHRIHLTYYSNADWKHRGSENCFHCLPRIQEAAIENTAAIGIELSKFCLDGFIFSLHGKELFHKQCYSHN